MDIDQVRSNIENALRSAIEAVELGDSTETVAVVRLDGYAASVSPDRACAIPGDEADPHDFVGFWDPDRTAREDLGLDGSGDFDEAVDFLLGQWETAQRDSEAAYAAGEAFRRASAVQESAEAAVTRALIAAFDEALANRDNGSDLTRVQIGPDGEVTVRDYRHGHAELAGVDFGDQDAGGEEMLHAAEGELREAWLTYRSNNR